MGEQTISRPEMTFPEAEADWVREAYAKANVILEYGSGGSTVMGGDLEGKTIFSVENARPWLRMMRGWFRDNPPKSEVHLHDGYVGETRKWGYPNDHEKLNRWPHYPLGIWESEGFVQPDLVLIDGRFRVGCFLATLFRTQAPVTVLYDDYIGRKRYSVVEDFAPIQETRGRMVRFELKPTPFPVENMARIMELMLRQQ
ncbi:MAG: hypothetical protein ACJA06_002215 [Halocynthiibacter sp.]|jgi:hypothetical protein